MWFASANELTERRNLSPIPVKTAGEAIGMPR